MLIIGGPPRLLADLVNAPSLNPDPGHVQGPDLTPRTTDPSPDPNLSPRQNRSPSEYVVNTAFCLACGVWMWVVEKLTIIPCRAACEFGCVVLLWICSRNVWSCSACVVMVIVNMDSSLFEGHVYWLKALIHNNFFSYRDRSRSRSASKGQSKSKSRSHSKTPERDGDKSPDDKKDDWIMCCIYVLCILRLLWKWPHEAAFFVLSLVT